jgi:hypothetical protein
MAYCINCMLTTLNYSFSLSPAICVTNCLQLENCLLDLHKWFGYNCLSLNADKIKCIFLSMHNALITLNLYLNYVLQMPLYHSSTIETFGVTLDSYLDFDLHTQMLTKTCYYHLKSFSTFTPLTDTLLKILPFYCQS